MGQLWIAVPFGDDRSDLGIRQASFVPMTLYPNTPYDYSAEAHGLVFTAGACPLDENGKIVAPGDYEAQAERAVDNLLAALAEHRIGGGSLLKTTIYVVARERRDLVRVWDVVSVRLGRAPSTLLGLSFLGYPDQLVEIEAVAALEPRGNSHEV